MAVIGGNVSAAELRAQILGAVQENIDTVKAAEAAFMASRFGPGAVFAPRGGSAASNPFLAGVDPQVAARDAERLRQHEKYQCEKKRCQERERCLSTAKVSAQTVTANPIEVLGINARRIAVIFAGMSAVPYMLGWQNWAGSANDPAFVFTGPQHVEVLEKDYGTAIGQPWYCGINAGGSVRLTITEIVLT